MEDVPPVPSTGFRGRTFRRKKTQPEPKKEVNIATVLPPSDDFRTSLLMPNLSARFSMLREQDDPNTKIGKANDDSVLFSKRASRLDLFGNGNSNLNDIAEVASLSGSIRRPFADERKGSYSSVDAFSVTTDDDGKNIMDRSRQVKGNKFFANRQKVYMIPAQGSASMKDLRQTGGSDKATRLMGKATYTDDINISTFHFSAEGASRSSDEKRNDDRNSDDRDRRGSLQHSDHNSKRETSSSTNSGPVESRASTAATSVASQSASPMHGPGSGSNHTGYPFTKPSSNAGNQDRAGKGKRLYGQGLDQQLHDQQSSALQRLNSIQRPLGAQQSRSATNLNDRFQKPAPLYSTNNFRSMSPVPDSSNGLSGFDFGVEDGRSRSNSRETHYQSNSSPTMSPPMSPTDPTLVAALEPNDVGKATASGAFNKPKTQYNDEQFAQRQLQLQEGRAETPPLTSFSRPGAYSSLTNRDRNGSSASQTSGHSVQFQTKSPQPLRVPSKASQTQRQASPAVGNQPINGAFLVSPGTSDFGSEPASPIDLATLRAASQSALNKVVDPTARHRKYEHDDQHPAFSTHLNLSEEDGRSEISQYLPVQHSDARSEISQRLPVQHADARSEISQHLPVQYTDTASVADNTTSSNIIDSPTLPIADDTKGSGGGLNDMILGHLRNFSNASSVYPNSPPRQSEEFFLDHTDVASIETSTNAPNDSMETRLTESDQPDTDPLSMRAKRILQQANQLKNAPSKPYEVLGAMGASKIQQVLGGEAPRRSNELARGPLAGGHTRGASTETQKEREEFANELADRRKQVQDNLKSFVEVSRSPSPVGNKSLENNSARNGPLGLLKKASRTSLVGRSENSSKAMKMLGVGSQHGLLSGQAPAPGPGPVKQMPTITSTDGYTGSRPVLNGDIRQRVPRQPEQQYKVGPGKGPSFRDRSIGAERRAAGFHGRHPPPSGRSGFDGPHPGMERSASAMSGKQTSPNPNGYGFVRSQTDNFNNVHHQGPPPMGRLRKYSPPSTGPRRNDQLAVEPPVMRSMSAQSQYSPHPQSPYSPGKSYFPPQPRSPNPQNNPFPPTFVESPRPSPVTSAFQARNTPPAEFPPDMTRNGSSGNLVQRPPPQHRKRSINKDEISTPTFLSSTSTVLTVDLPDGASLANGVEGSHADAPPVPPLNPRRRKAAPSGNLFTSFVNKSSHNLSAMSTPSSAATSPHSGTPFLQDPPHENYPAMPHNDHESRPRSRARLRKSSSDGGNMAARARHQALKEMDQMKMPMTPVYANAGGNNVQPMF